MKYLDSKPFTLPAVEKPPEKCEHGWRTAKGLCVFCGQVEPSPAEIVRGLVKSLPEMEWVEPEPREDGA